MGERRQSQKRGSRYRYLYLVMAAVVLAIIAIVVIIVTVTGGAKEKEDNGCMIGLECLPISECEGHRNLDFAYGCGDNDRVCCLSKVDNFAEVSTETRQLKAALLPTKCGLTSGQDRIANGVNATIGQFPWMALLGYTSPSLPVPTFLCGGTIINKKYILTAAHCTMNPGMKLELVKLGELNLLTKIDCEPYLDNEVCADEPLIIKVSKVIPHWKYNSTSLRHDIALLRLEQEILQYTDFIQPVCLPLKMKLDEAYLRNKSLTIAGWGKTFESPFSANVLQHARIKTWELEKCNEALPANVKPVNVRQICATGENFTEACRGDSGGPLLDIVAEPPDVKFTQLGVVSFKSYDTCGTVNIPSVFTRVDKYLDWILDMIEE
ncbi:Melanization Protease 1 [Carabus blaptoides fortunei]